MLNIILYIKGGHSLIFKENSMSHAQNSYYSLHGSDTDMLFCYQVALLWWLSGKCEIVGRTHSLYSTADVYSQSSRQGACARKRRSRRSSCSPILEGLQVYFAPSSVGLSWSILLCGLYSVTTFRVSLLRFLFDNGQSMSSLVVVCVC